MQSILRAAESRSKALAFSHAYQPNNNYIDAGENSQELRESISDLGTRAPTEPRNAFEAFHSCGFLIVPPKLCIKDMTVQTRYESANGFMVGTYFSCEVCAGTRAVDCMVFSSTELDENDIGNFETVGFSFHIFKTADWNTIDDSKPVVLNFN